MYKRIPLMWCLVFMGNGDFKKKPQKIPFAYITQIASNFDMAIFPPPPSNKNDFSLILTIIAATTHSGPENLKKSRPKKLVKSNKSISEKIFLAKFHFLRFQKWPKIYFSTGKKFKIAKKAIFHEFFFFIYLILQVFLPGLFLNFLSRCGSVRCIFTSYFLN